MAERAAQRSLSGPRGAGQRSAHARPLLQAPSPPEGAARRGPPSPPSRGRGRLHPSSGRAALGLAPLLPRPAWSPCSKRFFHRPPLSELGPAASVRSPLPTRPLPTRPLPIRPLPTRPLPTRPLPTRPLPTRPLPDPREPLSGRSPLR
ncbi:MAG: hypothetical protein CMN29_12605 [Sandaracinus sp.]|nr:hypothetical protein [Sandaracinus sp.]